MKCVFMSIPYLGRAHRSHRWGHRFESCCDHHNKYQLLIQRLVLFFYPIVARKPLLQGLSRTFSRKGILNQLHFSLRKQAWKVKLLSAPVFFTPPLSKWCILEFCQIFSLSKHVAITSSPSTRAAAFFVSL